MKRCQRIRMNPESRLNLGWQLVVGISVYMLAFYGMIWAANAGFNALFRAWNLTNETLIYAPRWAQRIVLEHTDVTYMLAYCASMGAVMSCTRGYMDPGRNVLKETGHAVLLGMGLGAVLTMIAFALDSMRLERPLREPALQMQTIRQLCVLFLGVCSREALTKRLVFYNVNARFGRAWSYTAVGILSVLLSGMWLHPVGLLNALLMGIAGCAVYERGGLWASEALMTGWSAWTAWLFAWPGTGTGVYRMYTVSDAWLTGGNVGAEAGVGCTLLWTIIAAILLRKELKDLMNRMNKRRSTNG